MKNLKVIPLLFIIVMIAFPSCSKSTTGPEEETTAFSPTIPDKSIIEFSYPVDAPDQVNEFLGQTVSGLSYIFLFMELLKNKTPNVSQSSYTWHGRNNSQDISLQATKTETDSIYWEYRLDGGSYENWLHFSGHTSLNNQTGFWKVYQFGLSKVLMFSSWLRDQSNRLTINNYVPYNVRNFNLTVDTNGNASLVVIGNNVRIFEADWDVSGHGSWISYNYPLGTKSENGSW